MELTHIKTVFSPRNRTFENVAVRNERAKKEISENQAVELQKDNVKLTYFFNKITTSTNLSDDRRDELFAEVSAMDELIERDPIPLTGV
jgi:hypothetical protein